MQTNFALIGAAGFVAPRHMAAIREVGGDLVAIYDPKDSVGTIDSYFPASHFFVEFERFDRYIDLMKRSGHAIDYISICSPNYLHDAHVRYALRTGAHAICEKPLVLNPWNIDGLAELEAQTGKRVNTILQLRLHPAVRALKERVDAEPRGKVHNVDLAYITSRGNWYYASWKGDEGKSGGIATNIGVHFYDMLSFVFGDLKTNVVHHRAIDCAAGYLEYERARVRWFLSINERDLPASVKERKQRTFRSITVDGTEIEFSEGFTDLHKASYQRIVEGQGFSIDQARPSIETVAEIRTAAIEAAGDRAHPFLEVALKDSEARYVDGWPA